MSETKIYNYNITADVNEMLETVCKQGVLELKSTSPKNEGQYANGWRYKKTGKNEFTIYQANEPALTHLLENGHLTTAKQKGKKKKTKAQPHIRPVYEKMHRTIASSIGKIKLKVKQ